MDGARLPLPSPTISPEAWERELGSYFDKDNLVQAFRYGWDLSLLPDPDPRDASSNHPSAMDWASQVDDYILAELQHGCLVGPLPESLPFPTYSSPLGTVPKPGSSKRRTITDCSQKSSRGLRGINAWIPSDSHRGVPWKIHLPGTTDIVHAIARLRKKHPGKRILMFKYDFSRYYRFFLVCPGQSPFLAVEWRGRKYMDRAFSFGNKGAQHGAQRTSNGVAWTYRTQIDPPTGPPNSGRSCVCPHDCTCGDNECLAYVDDCIGLVPEDMAQYLFLEFVALVSRLSLAPSQTPGHICEPSLVCVALGVEYDLLHNMVSLPPDKLLDITTLVHVWLNKDWASRQELASLTGKLLHCCQVVPPGRLHLGRMLETKRRADHLDAAVQLDQEFKLDLKWWASNMAGWNGRSILEFTHGGDVAIDASEHGWFNSKPGIGGYCFANNEFFATGVPDHMQDWPICDLELMAVLLAGHVWGPTWSGKQVSGLTDNEATRYFLNTGKSRIPSRLQMGRVFTSMQFRWNFRWHSARISTDQNKMADYLSRAGNPWYVSEFWRLCRNHSVSPREVSITPVMFNLDLPW